MEPTVNALLLKLGRPQYSADRGQLLWPCPLNQEQAAEVAPQLMARLECQLGALEQGADRLFWPARFEDTVLGLQFEALCDSLWLEASDGAVDGAETLAFLAAQVGAEHV
ncbi:DUF3630 family protein [Ferrimonas balearica]|uniref:DUF3630 family protein n=1 Tax=Ferrimonas balearica TaxID=44012 RepID=UPI001F3F27E8|nr:DUF3630 family protein [Ferrimonas balearica]MBY6096649.1 DUF3630 family protein [Ferrimonas balearica]